MRKLISFLIVFIFYAGVHVSVFGQSVSITDISPESPATLIFNNQINIHFDYQFRDGNNVRIFIRPFTSGNLTPNYAASGSPVYNGNGSGSANFTIKSGNVTVDQLRIQVLSTENELLFEFFIPVKFTFSSRTLPLVQFQLNGRAQTLQVRPENPQTISPVDTVDSENRVVNKTVTPEGVIELHYSDGTIIGIISSVERYIVNPATGDTTYTRLMFSNVQGADQPAAPPGFAATSTTDLEDEWLINLNEWIQYHGSRLLNRIDVYLEDEALENYKTFEENNSSTIYEKVNLRYTFLEKLLMTDTY
ncbi:hypothetical protein BH23BAC3_BH23BAC3_07650 [soil metagenome]